MLAPFAPPFTFGLSANLVAYLLRDTFDNALAAGAVNGTAATPGPGTRTVTDANSKLSITGGVASFATGGVGAGDPGLWYGAITRVLGRTLIGMITQLDVAGSTTFGWDSTASGNVLDSIIFSTSGGLFVRANGTTIAVGAYTATAYSVASGLRATGVYQFIKGGAFANWTLLWQSAAGAGVTLPAVTSNGGTITVFTADNIRIPVSLYIPTPLAYDTFTRANGALGTSETTGPDAQAVTGRAWTGSTFAVATNVAVNTPTLGSDVIVNGGFGADTDWTKGTGWTIAAGVASHATGTTASITQAILTIGQWYSGTFTLSNRSAGAFNLQFGSGNNPVSHSADGTFTHTGRAITSTAGGIRANSTGVGDIDNVSIKALTLSELFASLQASGADVLADVNVTGPTSASGIQAGLVINLDSAASPANFVIAYLDGDGNARLDKCVAGTYTSIISAAVTYSAGATLRVIKDGTSYRLFYSNLAVGSVSTISDAGIISNTLHGLFSTSPLNTLDNFQVFSRGTGNEYRRLDDF